MRNLTLAILCSLAPGLSAAHAQESTPPENASSAGIQIGLQGRLSAINTLPREGALAIDNVPFVTAGARLLDEKLFAGVGFGFFNVEDANDGISLSPVVSFDLLSGQTAALYVLGLATLGEIGDEFLFGLSGGAGVRAEIVEGLAIGSELGWGFLDVDRFIHGVFGTILFEAMLGI